MGKRTQTGFDGTRARFYRYRDAKVFNCWIEHYREHEVRATLTSEVPLQIGEVVRFELSGSTYRCSVDASVSQVLSLTPSDADIKGALSCLGFESAGSRTHQVTFDICGPARYEAQDETFRRSAYKLDVEITSRGQTMPARVIDMSLDGLAVRLPVCVQPQAMLGLKLVTPFGVITAEAEVRYCRRERTKAESYRVGAKCKLPTRLDKARWQRLLSECA